MILENFTGVANNKETQLWSNTHTYIYYINQASQNPPINTVHFQIGSGPNRIGQNQAPHIA